MHLEILGAPEKFCPGYASQSAPATPDLARTGV